MECHWKRLWAHLCGSLTFQVDMTSSFRKILCVVLGCDFFSLTSQLHFFTSAHNSSALQKRKQTDVLLHILCKAENPKEALLAFQFNLNLRDVRNVGNQSFPHFACWMSIDKRFKNHLIFQKSNIFSVFGTFLREERRWNIPNIPYKIAISSFLCCFFIICRS